jgi:hypothetical protein
MSVRVSMCLRGERHGCDTSPIDPSTEEGALTQPSYVWSDQIELFRRLRAAIDVARRVPPLSTAPMLPIGSRRRWPTAFLAWQPRSITPCVAVLVECGPMRFRRVMTAARQAGTHHSPLARRRFEPGPQHRRSPLTTLARGQRPAARPIRLPWTIGALAST